jgi:DNA polymerase-3 subunit alpha (Gram-positive type)
VKDAPIIDEVLPKFLKFAGSRIWVAQNASFDLSFILRDMNRLKIPVGERLVIDTIRISKILFPNAGSHNLDVLMARMGISKSGGRHRSLDDCRYTALVLIEFIKLLEKQGMDQLQHIKDAFIKTENVLKREKPKARGLFG